VLHRDIKPANVFLNWDGRVLLLDFGVARLPESSLLTQTGMPVGTPSFMPPEQAAGRLLEVDARSDLWSLGATLFTLLSGRTVRQTQSLEDELRAALNTPVCSLSTVRPLPQAITCLVDRALALDPAARFESAASMRDAVRDAMSSLGIALPSESDLPGMRAGFVPLAASESLGADEQPSAIRLKAVGSDLATIPEPEQWARKVRGGLSPMGVLLVLFALGGTALALWQPIFGVSSASLPQGPGVLHRVQASIARVARPDGIALGAHYAHEGRLALGDTADAIESLPEVMPVAHPRKMPVAHPRNARPQRVVPRRYSEVEQKPPPLEPEPFDPLAARL
jgi:serine/threonine protein kinase